MPEVIPIVLWAWVPVSLLLFWRLPAPRAAIFCMVGGWLFLPTARFADDVAGVAFPYWIMPACLPSDYWTTKARVIGIALVLGVMAFDPGAWRRWRPSWYDLGMLAWLLVPLISGLANRLSPVGAVADSAYLVLSWGVPYAIGRFYFGTPTGLDALARGIVAGGLVYIPLCLVEWIAGPVLYPAFYGFHPYQYDGINRYLGFRPIVYLEHGNQLGIWMASSALTASWLWWSGQMRRFWGIPGAIVAGVLVGMTIATQSVGAVLLLFAALAGLWVVRSVNRTWPIASVVVLVLAFLVIRATNLIDTKALVQRTALGRSVIDLLRRTDRSSLGWRLSLEERQGRIALQRPILGWGRWDWWRQGPERPWGLFSLVLGSYGVIGLALLVATFFLPIVAFLNLGPPRLWVSSSRAAATALAATLAINELDAIFNSNILLALMAVAGGLVGMKGHAEAASAWMKRSGLVSA